MMMKGLWGETSSGCSSGAISFSRISPSARSQLFAGLQLVAPHGGLQLVEQVLRRLDADVGHEQGGFQLLQHFVVDAPAEQAAELGAGARQAGLEPLGGAGAEGSAALSGVSDFFRKPNMGEDCLYRRGDHPRARMHAKFYQKRHN
jgi:hypothetical protein